MRQIININKNWSFGKNCPQVPEAMPEGWEQVDLQHSRNAVDGRDSSYSTWRVDVTEPLAERTLLANGKAVGKGKAADHFFCSEVPNEGETTLTAIADECRDESVIRKVEKFNEAYLPEEKGATAAADEPPAQPQQKAKQAGKNERTAFKQTVRSSFC